jgi:ABC-type oligopeptide transport system ATPase subunit
VENFNPFQAATEMQNPALDDQGRIVERGPTKQVLQHPRHSYTIQLLDAVANPFASPATKGTS